MNIDFNCKECLVKFEKQGQLIRHLKKIHAIDYSTYILKWIFNNKHPVCKCGCGTKVKILAHKPGYCSEYTTNHFPRKPHTEDTKARIKESYKNTMIDRYGVDNPMHLREFINKISDTKQDRYGNANYNNTKKNKATKLERHGNETYNNRDKAIITNIKKYGGRTFTATDHGKRQVQQTKLLKYGDSKYNNHKKNVETKLERYGYESEFQSPEWRSLYNSDNSKIELIVCQSISADPKFIHMGKVYDMKLDNYIIEVDGDYYHQNSLNDLNLIQLNTITNDYIKTRNLQNTQYELIRIKASAAHRLSDLTINSIIDNSYTQDFTLTYYQKVIHSSTLKSYISKKGKEKLNQYIGVFVKFIRTLQPELPNIEQKEQLVDVIIKIQNYNLTAILIESNSFTNNCSNVGVNYLKSNFQSYWKASFKNRKSPMDAWEDPEIMRKIIKYRIGINNSNEIFDFSLHQLVRGLSANRYTVSFFKPILAAAIYFEFLKDNPSPVVLDPCAGFGGRLLGFKSKYPNGTYIGVEPNIETYTELLELSKNFSNVILYNCKIEDLDMTQFNHIDMSFTSIPYYDLETYSNPIEYKSEEDWDNTFIEAIKQLPNLVVNIPENLRGKFNDNCVEYKIISNTSHFNKSKNIKFEYLLSYI